MFSTHLSMCFQFSFCKQRENLFLGQVPLTEIFHGATTFTLLREARLWISSLCDMEMLLNGHI
jgi:hypothetical protein